MNDVRRFEISRALAGRFHDAIPGGAHTYAKGDDQYPDGSAPILVRGKGCQVWDVDGNEFIEYGMGMRAVTLGHAYAPVVDAACRQMDGGSNFTRPSLIELECAEEFLSCVAGAEMVKFAKNGSDVTTAAVKLARAVTGRDMVAICGDQPFLSTDDWFIGTTAMSAGVPAVVQALTVKFHYNDIESLDRLFAAHPGQVACVIMEAETVTVPCEGFLRAVQASCRREGALLIFDETITGFRWHLGGAQAFHSVIPDLSAFGKALGNGFSVSALAGRREFMERGGLRHGKNRVFLLSTTHGAECHGLAAARVVMQVYREKKTVETLWRQGQRLADGVRAVIAQLGLDGYFEVVGRPCNLVYVTRDQARKPSQGFRTLFLRETIQRGLLAPSFVVSAAHGDADIDTTIDRVGEALVVYKRALADGLSSCLRERPVKPVFRALN
jgi:glutamate-1-semialdehyde 2,1-aminomutase